MDEKEMKIIEKKSTDFIYWLIKRASKKSDFLGRNTIRPRDLE
jgi:hypothetical protein